MRIPHLCLFGLMCLGIVGCTPDSSTGQIRSGPDDFAFTFSNNGEDSPTASGRASVRRNGALDCTFEGPDPQTGEDIVVRTQVIIPGLFARLEQVLEASGPVATSSNRDSGLGQLRTAPYRTPTGQIIDLLNAVTAPSPCMPDP